jgi:hypothetical protein
MNNLEINNITLEKHVLPIYKNLWKKFWFETLSENIQGQKQIFDKIYSCEEIRRQKMGIPKLSYTRLLAELQCFAIQEGLPLYGVLQKSLNRKL